MSNKSNLLEALSNASREWEEAVKEYEVKNDAWWNSLTETEREDAFYAVVKRIYQGEIKERGSYRYVLYNVFGFGPGMYVQGMECGYMELHNAIYTHEEMRELRDRELASKGIEVETTMVKLKND
jgi:hypothetical protein